MWTKEGICGLLLAIGLSFEVGRIGGAVEGGGGG